MAKPFQQWLATSIEAVGDADLKNASRDERDELAAPSPEVELIAQNGTDASGADSGKGKGNKRSKRKG